MERPSGPSGDDGFVLELLLGVVVALSPQPLVFLPPSIPPSVPTPSLPLPLLSVSQLNSAGTLPSFSP